MTTQMTNGAWTKKSNWKRETVKKTATTIRKVIESITEATVSEGGRPRDRNMGTVPIRAAKNPIAHPAYMEGRASVPLKRIVGRYPSSRSVEIEAMDNTKNSRKRRALDSLVASSWRWSSMI